MVLPAWGGHGLHPPPPPAIQEHPSHSNPPTQGGEQKWLLGRRARGGTVCKLRLYCPIRFHLQNTNPKVKLFRIPRWPPHACNPKQRDAFELEALCDCMGCLPTELARRGDMTNAQKVGCARRAPGGVAYFSSVFSLQLRGPTPPAGHPSRAGGPRQ